jgi:proteasome alpha subunit
MLDHLEEQYRAEMDLGGGIGLALETLATATDDPLDAAELGVATIDVETEEFVQLDDDEIESYLDEHDLPEDADDTDEE